MTLPTADNRAGYEERMAASKAKPARKAKPAGKRKPAAAPRHAGKAKAAQAGTHTAEAGNRYERIATILIEQGEGVDLAELAVRARVSAAAAKYGRDAYTGVTALRAAGLLPNKVTPAKAPVAPPKAREKAEAA